MMTELLTLVYIRDVNLYARTLQAADAILQGDAGMGISTGVEHHAIVGEAHFLQLVDEFTLDVALVILNLHIRILSLQLRQVALERVAAVNAWFANAQEVQIRTINNLYLHNHDDFLSLYHLFFVSLQMQRAG